MMTSKVIRLALFAAIVPLVVGGCSPGMQNFVYLADSKFPPREQDAKIDVFHVEGNNYIVNAKIERPFEVLARFDLQSMGEFSEKADNTAIRKAREMGGDAVVIGVPRLTAAERSRMVEQRNTISVFVLRYP